MAKNNKASEPLQPGKIIHAQVIERQRWGLRVLLEDGQEGIIRSREFSWDRRVSVPVDVPQLGAHIEAVTLEQRPGEGLILSLRQVTRPWEDAFACDRYKVGQTVEGEVVRVWALGAIIQLEPGVDGLLPAREMSLAANAGTEAILSRGDQVRARIEEIDRIGHKIFLSLTYGLLDPFADHERPGADLLERFGMDSAPGPAASFSGSTEATNDQVSAQPQEDVFSGEGDGPIHRIHQDILTSQPSSERLAEILSLLKEQTQAAWCCLLELDLATRQGKILAIQPPLSPQNLLECQDGLFFSPARAVIEDEFEFYDANVRRETDAKYRTFLPLLDFETVLGIPVRTSGRETRHALFVLFDEPQDPAGHSMGGYRTVKVYACTAASMLRLVLERIELMDHLQAHQREILLGEIFGDLAHEANNKLSALSSETRAAEVLLARFPEDMDPGRVRDWRSALEGSIHSMLRIQGSLKDAFSSSTRMARGEFSRIDANEIVEGALRKLARTAHHNYIRIQIDAGEVPAVLGIDGYLEQVIMNLVLNSIQMIELANTSSTESNTESSGKKRKYPERRGGIILFQTRLQAQSLPPCVEIRVIDSGPGVHWKDRERMFSPGFSTRGGAGLGLTISRNLIERMKGRLRLADSLCFFGTAFSITLPIAE